MGAYDAIDDIHVVTKTKHIERGDDMHAYQRFTVTTCSG